jgi:hypothetical protein
MGLNVHHDAHERPPELLRARFKKVQRQSLLEIDEDPYILDFTKLDSINAHARTALVTLDHEAIEAAVASFLGYPVSNVSPVIVYEVKACPGAVLSETSFPPFSDRSRPLHIPRTLVECRSTRSSRQTAPQRSVRPSAPD